MNDINVFIDFMNKLYEFSRVFREYEAIPRDYGVDSKLYMNEVHTLSIVFENEGITVSEIVNIEKKTQSAISQKINKLEKKGLIKKERNPIEYKKINLYTTDIGKSVCISHNELDESIYKNLMKNMTNCDEKDYAKFIEMLDLLTPRIQKNVNNSKK